MRTLKPSALREDPEKVLDKALKRPQYVKRNGVLIVIKRADLVSPADDNLLASWEQRAEALEKFYEPAKTW